MPRKLLIYRLRLLCTIAAIWVVFGVVFFENLIRGGNDLGVQVSLPQFCLVFAVVGFIIGAALIFFLKPAFNHQPLWLSTFLKLGIDLFLFVVIVFLLLLLYYVVLYNGDFFLYLQSFFTKILYTRTFLVFLLDLGLLTLLSITYLEITDKYGPGLFWSMLVGKYHHPQRESRIFIFMDINESTTIAEDLGHQKYFYMLRRFYRDITLPVMANDGEIYQYVGDEIVMSWPNTPENKIKSLKFLRNSFYLIERLSPVYQKKYGHVPRFKAGVHAGEVTAGFIGVIKKDLIYSGDTLNTAARIRSLCHELGEHYLVSEDFMHDFSQPYGYTITERGTCELKGRSTPTKLFAVKFEHHG